MPDIEFLFLERKESYSETHTTVDKEDDWSYDF